MPERAIVVQGTRMREFPGGTFGLPCALVLRYLAEGEGHDQLAAQRDPPRARRGVVNGMADLLALTEELCAIPSVSGEEHAIADVVEARLRARRPSLRVERIGNNVVARTERGLERRIVLGGHLDTVPPNGNSEPRRKGDVLHGLGTADMKGGLAVLLALAAGARRRSRRATTPRSSSTKAKRSPTSTTVCATSSPSARELVDGDLAILLEPTGGWVEAGCQGTISVRATFDGVRAHSARPWMGTNAIHRAAPLLERLASFEAATVDVDGLEYREALQVVRVEGGIANNVVPDRCVSRRQPPLRAVPTLDDAVDEVPRCVRRRRRRRRRGAERVGGGAAEPLESAHRRARRRVQPAGATQARLDRRRPASPRTASRR